MNFNLIKEEIIMLHSLSDVSTFKYSELMASQKITNIIKNIVSEKNGTIYVTEEQLEDVLYKIRHKSFNFSAKFPVLNLFKKGVIKLIYTEKIKLTVEMNEKEKKAREHLKNTYILVGRLNNNDIKIMEKVKNNIKEKEQREIN